MSFFKEKQNLRDGAAVLLLSAAAAKLIGALFKIPLASDSVLGDLGFGYFSSAYDLYSPVTTLAMSGIPVAISRTVAAFAAEERFSDIKAAERVSKRFFCSLGLLLTLIMLGIGFLLTRSNAKADGTAYAIAAVAPAFIICFWTAVWRGLLEGFHNMTYTAFSGIIEALGKLVFGLGAAYAVVKFTENAVTAAAAAITGITLGMLMSGIYLRLKYSRSALKTLHGYESQYTCCERDILKMLIAFSLPAVLSSLSGSAAALIDAVTVRWQLKSVTAAGELEEIYSVWLAEYSASCGERLSLTELPTVLYGIRSKAYTLYNLVPTITVAFGISAIPSVTESFTKGETEAVNKSIASVLRLCAFVSFPAAAGFISSGTAVMSLLYGEGVSSTLGGEMLCIYGIAAIFAGFVVPMGCVLQALNRKKAAFLNVAAGIAVKLILNLALCAVPGINIFGSVISTAAFVLTVFILNLFSLLKALDTALDFKDIALKPAIAALLCGVTAFAFRTIFGNSGFVTVLSIAVAAAVYFSVFGCLNPDLFKKALKKCIKK